MRRTWKAALVFSMLGAGCGNGDAIIACPDGGTTLTYDNFGRGWINGYCQVCHAGSVLDRQGAPSTVTFDTLQQIVDQRERVLIRAAGDRPTMPPGPDKPPLEDRHKLSEWLACEPR